MATVSYRLEDLKKAIVGIGYVGENDHMHVLIDCKEAFDEYPAAVPTMVIVPPVGDSYPKAVTRNGDVVEWLVKNSDVTVEGDGEFQLTFTEDEVIKKSVNGRFRVKRSISGSGEAPSGVQDWMTDANEKLAAVEEATQEAEAAAEHQPKINASGYWEIWDAEQGAYVATTVKAQGDKGDPGDPGSPGDPTELIDDTAGEGVTDKTLSADKLAEKFGDVLTDIQGVEDKINHSYSSVSNMLADSKLIAGMMVKTQGFTSSGDDGGGIYLIVDSATTNSYDTFATENGKYAVLQHGGHVNAKQCGLTNNTYGGDAWFAFYNGTALSMDVNVRMYVSQTIQLNNTTEIYSSNKSELYYTGAYDAAVLSCFSGNGLSASEYQSTRRPKIHDLTINARNAKVGVCLVNIANSYHEISNIYVYKGYVGFLLGQNWRNTFGLLSGEEQTYATFVQEMFPDATLSDFTAISDNGSINSSVFEYLLSTKSQNGALFDGYGSDNTILMLDVGLDLNDTEQEHIACRFKYHSGTINTIYCEHNNYEAASYTDLYVDNLKTYGDAYDYNKGLIINEIRGRRFYLNNNVVIGTMYIEDWVDVTHLHAIDFSGGLQADRVTILHLPQGKFKGTLPYGVCGVAQELAKLKPEYELIDTVEFSSAGVLSKNTKPNGDAYNFESMYVEITLPSNTTFPSCNIKFYDESNNEIANPYYSSVSADANNSKYAFIKVWNEKGFVWEEHGLFTTSGGSQTLIKAANTVYKSSAKIAKILSTQQMQPGTIVQIYAY